MSAVIVKGDISESAFQLLRGSDCIAWDIETSGLDWRTEKIGTCQIYAPETGVIVTQISSTVPTYLRQLLIDPGVPKIFHHAIFDLRFMAHAWKAEPSNIRCTKVASKLLWPKIDSDQHSLKALLNRVLNVRISKAQRLTDWTSNTLTYAQIEYASGDVKYLPKLLETLQQEMRSAGLDDLFSKCMEFMPARVELDLGEWPDIYSY
ncbi:ribonuclease D [Actinomadura geliboluensis]|uniref:ribonuclease D n=1 Tax=Actinomadura geliboluensis TaxID=882440 RepID=UPI00371E8888